MVYKYKFYMWLIDTLIKQPLTLPEIIKKWEQSPINDDGNLLNNRSFARYRREAESLMDVSIIFDKAQNNVYRIEKDDDFPNSTQDWMLSAFRISQLSKRVNAKNNIILEEAPPAAFRLQEIMHAIDLKLTIELSYKSHYSDFPDSFKFKPAFVKLFKQRWYVIGFNIDKQSYKTLALERIHQLNILEDEPFKFTKQQVKLLDPDTYFENCYGVIREKEPTRITFRAFWPQDAYLKDTPLHHSQKVINKTEDYTDYEVFLRPSFDLIQEFLWNREQLVVLTPAHVKQEMVDVLQKSLKNYADL